MRVGLTLCLLLYFQLTTFVSVGQVVPGKVCRIDEGRLIFTLDSRWSSEERKKISRIFNLDSALLAGAFALKPVIKENNNTWTTRKLDAYLIELSKEQAKSGPEESGKNKIFLVDDKSVNLWSDNERESVPFGVNRMTRLSVVQLSGGRVQLFLPGHREARSIFVSGSFNAWATRENPMQPCDSGWISILILKPGKYTYKYIIDGKWTNDSFNKLLEDDTYDGHNNVFFCYNYTFVLNGYNHAGHVLVSGSFNNWNETELRMFRFRGSWVLPMYLREGTHAYKFIVDKEWITDPANTVRRPDGAGHQNSFLGIGDTLFFKLQGYPAAGKVTIAGNFNGWNTDELFMEKTPGGWQLPYVLASGNYEYKYVVDGKWITDPGNPYITGEDDQLNSFLAVKPNRIFKLEHFPAAKKVILTGSFNGWDASGYKMTKLEGTWYCPLSLKPGKYTYKFIVDGKWIRDPGNDLWEDNEYGTGNSVLWIEP